MDCGIVFIGIIYMIKIGVSKYLKTRVVLLKVKDSYKSIFDFLII